MSLWVVSLCHGNTLMASGDVKPLRFDREIGEYEIILTNYEVQKEIEKIISYWFNNSNADGDVFRKALLTNNIEKMNLSYQNDLAVRIEKLENELYKSLQFNTNNNTEYNNCVLNEIKFLKLCKKVELFYTKTNNLFGIAKIYLLVIMLI